MTKKLIFLSLLFIAVFSVTPGNVARAGFDQEMLAASASAVDKFTDWIKSLFSSAGNANDTADKKATLTLNIHPVRQYSVNYYKNTNESNAVNTQFDNRYDKYFFYSDDQGKKGTNQNGQSDIQRTPKSKMENTNEGDNAESADIADSVLASSASVRDPSAESVKVVKQYITRNFYNTTYIQDPELKDELADLKARLLALENKPTSPRYPKYIPVQNHNISLAQRIDKLSGVDFKDGTIEGTAIGQNNPAPGNFTSLNTSSLVVNGNDVTSALTNFASGNITGNQTINGDLTVTGSSSLGTTSTGDLTVSGNSSVSGNSGVGGNLAVSGNTAFNGALNAQGNVDFDSNLNVDGNTTMGGDLSVSGNSTLTSADIGNLTVSGSFSAPLPHGNLWRGNASGQSEVTNAIYIADSGNIGIGTTSPSAKLDVTGDTKSQNFIAGNNAVKINGTDNVSVGPDIEIASQGLITAQSNLFINIDSDNNSTNDALFIGKDSNATGGTVNLMTIRESGNVGIGTTNPSVKLEVVGDPRFLISNTGADSSVKQGLFGTKHYLNSEEPLYALQAYTSASQNLVYIGGGTNYGNAATEIRFNTASNNTTLNGTTRMVINNSGNVGIGTTSPIAKLDVVGGGRFNMTDNQTLDINSDISTDATNYGVLDIGMTNTGGSANYKALARFALESASTQDIQAGIRVIDNSSNADIDYGLYISGGLRNYFAGKVGIGTANPGDKLTVSGGAISLDHGQPVKWGANSVYGYTSGTNALLFNTAGAERMRIDADGNVGIGTTSPSYKLDVVGDIRTTGDFYGNIHVNDTRNTDDPPTAFDNEVSFDFKSRNTIGAPGSSTYGGLMTIAPWKDNSGGAHHQLFFSSEGISYRQGQPESSSWGNWYGAIFNGNVGIGTVNPTRPLTVENGSILLNRPNDPDGGWAGLIEFAAPGSIAPANSTNFKLIHSINSSGSALYFRTFNDDGSSKGFPLTIMHSGNVGIGTTNPGATLQVGTSGDGTSALANAWNTFSDRRLKKDIKPLEGNLEKLLKLNAYTYKWKEGTDQSLQLGLIAQEVQKVYPEAVREVGQGDDSFLTVSYGKLVAPVIGAIKELWNKVTGNDKRISELEKQVNELKAKVAQLQDASARQGDLNTNINSQQEEHVFTMVLNGDAVIEIDLNEIYRDQGATATVHNSDGSIQNIDVKVSKDGAEKVSPENLELDTSKEAEYTLVYSASWQGEEKTVERTVKVIDKSKSDTSASTEDTGDIKDNDSGADVDNPDTNSDQTNENKEGEDTKAPEITVDPQELTVEAGESYTDTGVTATDDKDGDLTDKIQKEGSVDTSKLGTYTIIYKVSDSSGNEAVAERQVTVADTIAPQINILSGNDEIKVGDTWQDSGATAQDSFDGDLTNKIKVSGEVDTSKAGSYTITYSAEDSSGNKTERSRIVIVNE